MKITKLCFKCQNTFFGYLLDISSCMANGVADWLMSCF